MLPSWLSTFIARSGLKGGMGMVPRAEYYSGMPVCKTSFPAKKLVRLYEEFVLQEAMEEIPEGSAKAFCHLIHNAKLLRRDAFIRNLEALSLANFAQIEWNQYETRPDDEMAYTCSVVASTRRRPLFEKEDSEQIKKE